jgi:hypothetical protein
VEPVKTLVWPLRLENGRLAQADQDSPADVESCVTAILSYPRGWRPDNVNFGRPELLFQEGGVDIAAIAEALSDMEPRATPDIVASVLEKGRQTVGVEV